MNGQNFMSFAGNTSSSMTSSNAEYERAREIFRELFVSIYGIKNVDKLKDGYPYFDKYGKQRKIEFAIFLGCRKIAVMFEDFTDPVLEEYKSGEKKIVGTSLKSQGWELFYWDSKGEGDLVRDRTLLDLKRIYRDAPNFKNNIEYNDLTNERVNSPNL